MMTNRLEQRFREAGTTFETRSDGRIAVRNWPALRQSSTTFLSDEFARWEAEQKAAAEAADQNDQPVT
jgi:hypothetical protein